MPFFMANMGPNIYLFTVVSCYKTIFTIPSGSQIVDDITWSLKYITRWIQALDDKIYI